MTFALATAADFTSPALARRFVHPGVVRLNPVTGVLKVRPGAPRVGAAIVAIACGVRSEPFDLLRTAPQPGGEFDGFYTGTSVGTEFTFGVGTVPENCSFQARVRGTRITVMHDRCNTATGEGSGTGRISPTGAVRIVVAAGQVGGPEFESTRFTGVGTLLSTGEVVALGTYTFQDAKGFGSGTWTASRVG